MLYGAHLKAFYQSLDFNVFKWNLKAYTFVNQMSQNSSQTTVWYPKATALKSSTNSRKASFPTFCPNRKINPENGQSSEKWTVAEEGNVRKSFQKGQTRKGDTIFFFVLKRATADAMLRWNMAYIGSYDHFLPLLPLLGFLLDVEINLKHYSSWHTKVYPLLSWVTRALYTTLGLIKQISRNNNSNIFCEIPIQNWCSELLKFGQFSNN